MVEITVVQLFGEAERASESGTEIKALVVICTIVKRYVAKDIQSSDLQNAVKKAVRKSLAESRVANDVTTDTMSLPAFTVPVAKFVGNEV